MVCVFFFFKQKTAYEMRISDWSSDVCSSDLSKPEESGLLFRDLLINVTCFFRDAEGFDFLRREVIPELLRNKGAGDTIRIWTPGCSSGEEAYSIAILIAEAMSRMQARPTVQHLRSEEHKTALQSLKSIA